MFLACIKGFTPTSRTKDINTPKAARCQTGLSLSSSFPFSWLGGASDRSCSTPSPPLAVLQQHGWGLRSREISRAAAGGYKADGILCRSNLTTTTKILLTYSGSTTTYTIIPTHYALLILPASDSKSEATLFLYAVTYICYFTILFSLEFQFFCYQVAKR